MNSPWTDERTADAIRLREAGLSCKQIAEEMNCGISRNAVIGKLARLGIPSEHAAANRRAAVMRAQKKKAQEARFKRSKREHRIADRAKNSSLRNVMIARAVALGELSADEPVTLTSELVTRPPVALLDLRPDHCRWPICDDADNTIGFCGAPRRDNGVSYCGSHCQRVFAVHRNMNDEERDRLRFTGIASVAKGFYNPTLFFSKYNTNWDDSETWFKCGNVDGPTQKEKCNGL